MWIVVYRPHNALNIETQFYGPFVGHDAAYDFLCTLPALGWHQVDADTAVDNPGVKYCQELESPTGSC